MVISSPVAQKDVLGVELTPDARKNLDAATVRLRLKKKDLLSLVLDWFVRQDDTVQRLVVGHIPAELQPDVARMILERMAGGDDADAAGGGVTLPKQPTPPVTPRMTADQRRAYEQAKRQYAEDERAKKKTPPAAGSKGDDKGKQTA